MQRCQLALQKHKFNLHVEVHSLSTLTAEETPQLTIKNKTFQ